MSTPNIFSSHLCPIIVRYLALKHALGRCYTHEGNVLAHLDRFLANRACLTAETLALWIATFAHLSATGRRNWMRIARNLCLYQRRSEPACFVPDPSDFPRPHAPRRPHLFTVSPISLKSPHPIT